MVAGNVPYSICGRLLGRTTELAPQIDRAVLMVQREVADRIAAPPGGRTYGVLSVFVQAAFSVKKLFRVRAGAFHPRPRVDSAVIGLDPLRPPRAVENDELRQVVKKGFSTRRKKLRNAWKGLGGWSAEQLQDRAEQAGISLDARAETLSVEAFGRMAALLERLE